jgi:hypothetical protein
MKYVQIVAIESPGGCNYTDRHPQCPSRILGRDKPAAAPMSPVIAAAIGAGLAELGFRGFYGFHWYSEPMCSLEWVEETMAGIRATVDRPRFVLWTNGALLTSETWDFAARFDRIAARFDRIFISNYDGQGWAGLRERCAQTGCVLEVWQRPRLDGDRMTPPDPARKERAACVRPYTEFAVTREGDVAPCCQAWRPSQRLGNVLRDGLPECVRRFQAFREEARDPARQLGPGHPCQGCVHPAVVMLRWDAGVAREAEAGFA